MHIKFAYTAYTLKTKVNKKKILRKKVDKLIFGHMFITTWTLTKTECQKKNTINQK